MAKGKLFILSSPSGSGKTTLRDVALQKIDNLEKIITMTSRPPRDGEVEAVDYYFRDREYMLDMNYRNKMVEMVESYGNLYGTPKAEIESKLDSGKHIIIILDVYGKMNFDKVYDSVGIFIDPPSAETLTDRIMSRTTINSAADIDTAMLTAMERVARADEEVSKASQDNLYKYHIDGNGSIEECSEALIGILNGEITSNE